MNEGKGAMATENLTEITVADIQEFLKEKNVRTICGECGTGTVALAFERQGKTPTLLSMDQTEPEIAGALVNYYFQLICTNCGHVRMFEKSTVWTWKTARGGDNAGI